MGSGVVRLAKNPFYSAIFIFFLFSAFARAETIPVQVAPCPQDSAIQEPFLCSLKKAVDSAKPNDRITFPSGVNTVLDRTLGSQHVNQKAADVAAYLGTTLTSAFQKGLTLSASVSGVESAVIYSGVGNHVSMPTTLPRPSYSLIVSVNACLSAGSTQFQIDGLKFRNIHFRFSGASCTGANLRTKATIKNSRFELYRPVFIRPCVVDYSNSPDCNLNISGCESYTLNAIISFRLMSELTLSSSIFYRLPVEPVGGAADTLGNGILFVGVNQAVLEKSYVIGRLVTALNVTPTTTSAGAFVPSSAVRIENNVMTRETQDGLSRRKPGPPLGEDHGLYAHGFDDLLIKNNQVSGWSQCATGYSFKLRNGKNLKVLDNTLYNSGIATYTYQYPADKSFEAFDHVQISNNRIVLNTRGTQQLACGAAAVEPIRQCMIERDEQFERSPNSIFYWSTIAGVKAEHDVLIEKNRFQGDLRVFTVTDKNQWRLLQNRPEPGGVIQCPQFAGQVLPDLSGKIVPAFPCP